MTPDRRGEFRRLFIALACVSFFTVPVFRSGGRTNLTGGQWLLNHTIFGPAVEYVPEEDYARELEGVKITTTVSPIGNLDRVMGYYQLREPSARKLIQQQGVA